jgi:hypothetical protein
MSIQAQNFVLASGTGVGGQQIVPGISVPEKRITVHYTGFTSNAAANSRTAINEDVTVGSIVCWDPVNGTSGTPNTNDISLRLPTGMVTRPQTSLLALCAGVVTSVPATSKRGGLIEIAPLGSYIGEVRATKGSAVAVGDFFGPQDGSFVGANVTLDATNAGTITSSIQRMCFKSLQITSGAITDQIINTASGFFGTPSVG